MFKKKQTPCKTTTLIWKENADEINIKAKSPNKKVNEQLNSTFSDLQTSQRGRAKNKGSGS